MEKKKIEKYGRDFFVGIHTLSGTVNKEIDAISDDVKQCIKRRSIRRVGNDGEKETYLQINPNKINGTNELIESYAVFCDVLEYILAGCGCTLEEFTIKRVDLCFNSDDPENFLAYKKLHKLILSCLAYEYNVKNTYKTYDLWSDAQLNTYIKNDTFEAVNYDKDRESNGRDRAKNRLELRSKKLERRNDIKHEFLKVWYKRLDAVVDNFDGVQQSYNAYLEKTYKEDFEKPKKEKVFTSPTDFSKHNKNRLFCTAQTVDLLSRFDDVKNPDTVAENFKRRHSIEYFSKSNLKYAVKVLKKNMRNYFKS